MSKFNFKNISFIVTNDKQQVIPFIKLNQDRIIVLILDGNKILRNSKRAIYNYVKGDYRIVDSYIAARLIAKNRIRVVDLTKDKTNMDNTLVIKTRREKQIKIFRSEVDTEQLTNYVKDIQNYLKTKNVSKQLEQEEKTM